MTAMARGADPLSSPSGGPALTREHQKPPLNSLKNQFYAKSLFCGSTQADYVVHFGKARKCSREKPKKMTADVELSLNTDTVGQAGLIEPLCVPPVMTVSEVLVLMKQHDTGCVLVCRDEQLVGIFTARDVLRMLATEADLDVAIESEMASNPVSLTQSNTVGSAIQQMTTGGYRHLPVVDESGCPVGLLKVRGIIHYLVEHFPNTIYNLPPDPRVVPQEREGA